MTPARPGPASGSKVLVGLIGSGIQQSMSPLLHEEEGRRQGLRLHYQVIDLDRSAEGAAELPVLLRAARTMGFAGLNVTHPCKQAVIGLLDELSEEARAIGAVNTVVLDGARLVGHNTDSSGFGTAFRRRLPDAPMDRVVLLGAGGAGAAVAHAALRLGTVRLTVIDSDAQRAQALAAGLQAQYASARVEPSTDVAAAIGEADGLIHATPTGMDAHPGLPIDEALLRPDLWVAEIVYFPLQTRLLEAARSRGCRTVDGGGMAVWQAVGAFELFTGIKPDAERMEAHFRRLIDERARAAA